MEAVASEVACLRRSFPGSAAWGVDPARWLRLSWRPGIGVHPRLQLAFRAITSVLQCAFDVNHIFGGIGDWFHLKAVRKKPTVLTLAVHSMACDRKLLEKVDEFVVEWPQARQDLEQLGIPRNRIQLVFPPVDVRRFQPSARPGGPFTALFASSPDDAEWLNARGVPLILEAAALRPDMQFRLLWRPWGNSLSKVQGWITERGLSNVALEVGRVAQMSCEYQRAHVTLAPFTQIERCKPSPNSVIESLASGRPVVVTPVVGLSELISESGSGVTCAPNAASLADALDRVERDWTRCSMRARDVAERFFGLELFVSSYQRLYQSLTRL